jgi:CYTH domain-containing protein
MLTGEIPREIEKKFLISKPIMDKLISEPGFDISSHNIIEQVYLSMDWQPVLTRIRIERGHEIYSEDIKITETTKTKPIDGYPGEIEVGCSLFDDYSVLYKHNKTRFILHKENGFPCVSKTRRVIDQYNYYIMIDEFTDLVDHYIVEIECKEDHTEEVLNSFDILVNPSDRTILDTKEWSNFSIAKDGVPVKWMS